MATSSKKNILTFAKDLTCSATTLNFIPSLNQGVKGFDNAMKDDLGCYFYGTSKNRGQSLKKYADEKMNKQEFILFFDELTFKQSISLFK
jgi:hypothetical protein